MHICSHSRFAHTIPVNPRFRSSKGLDVFVQCQCLGNRAKQICDWRKERLFRGSARLLLERSLASSQNPSSQHWQCIRVAETSDTLHHVTERLHER